MADFSASDEAANPSLVAQASGPFTLNGTTHGGDVVDHSAPTVTAITPMTGSILAPTTPIQFSVAKSTGLAQLVVEASYVGSNTRELIWDSKNGFTGFYLGTTNQCAQTATGGITTLYTFTILRDGGWPANVDITVFAVDTFGNAA